jgi:HAE1 family hydrophobic/amphiphilic exporter-1
VAVFIPIFFMPGVIGQLFHEFAVIVSLAILASAFVSLTLVPMLASRFLKSEHELKAPSPLVAAMLNTFERGFNASLRAYTNGLDLALRHRKIVLLIALATFAATAYLFNVIPKRLFPQEDIGQINVSTEAAEDTSFPAMVALQDQVAKIIRDDPSVLTATSFNGGSGSQNTGRMFINLKPRDQRKPMKEVVDGLRKKSWRFLALCLPATNAKLAARWSSK